MKKKGKFRVEMQKSNGGAERGAREGSRAAALSVVWQQGMKRGGRTSIYERGFAVRFSREGCKIVDEKIPRLLFLRCSSSPRPSPRTDHSRLRMCPVIAGEKTWSRMKTITIERNWMMLILLYYQLKYIFCQIKRADISLHVPIFKSQIVSMIRIIIDICTWHCNKSVKYFDDIHRKYMAKLILPMEMNNTSCK